MTRKTGSGPLVNVVPTYEKKILNKRKLASAQSSLKSLVLSVLSNLFVRVFLACGPVFSAGEAGFHILISVAIHRFST